VIVAPSVRLCITLWLPRWRTATNPLSSRIRQTCDPEKTRSLPNRYFDLGYKNLAMKAPRRLSRIGGLEEQGERLDEVRSGILNRRTLAGYIELGTQRYKPFVFTLDNRGQTSGLLHDPSVQPQAGLPDARTARSRSARHPTGMLCGRDYFALNRFSASGQFTTLHHAPM
jgi:hypothetical protein